VPAAAPRRGRGRPPKSEGLLTAQALLDAAAEVCAERGFDGTTVALVARRIGVSPTAVYNHYANREDLLYAAAVQGLERITRVSLRSMRGPDAAPALASAYLRPEMRSTRRLLAELHLASGRDERLASLLAEWHRTWTRAMVERLPAGDPAPEATVKTVFLLLLGLCHYEDLPAVRASRAAVSERAELAFRTLSAFGGAGRRAQ
jgi:AcrR family transcriptional regulator